VKLLNQSLLYLCVPLFLVVSLWSVAFYLSMFNEIYDSMDDGLDNSKGLIIHKARTDADVLGRQDFDEANYAIRRLRERPPDLGRDVYQDTLMFMVNEAELEPIRMLTTTFEQDGAYYQLRTITSMVEEDDQIENLLWSVVSLYLLLLVSIAVINNLALRRLWTPFYEYLERLKNFRLDADEEPAAMKTRTREFQELQRSADALILHSRAVYRNQKRFNEHAAHELQTPLAIITGKLELLLEEGRLSTADAATVSATLRTAARLIKLNKTLLLLSKIENKQFFDNQPVSINGVVSRVIAELEELIEHRDIDLRYLRQEELTLHMDPHLAYVLVANLLRNAIFHNLPGGRITVELSASRLMVRNTSATGELSEREVFRRFYRHDERRRGSSGLGLAIVQAIARLYGFGLHYAYDGAHEFSISRADS
jgi:signal transduction histidine kinase